MMPLCVLSSENCQSENGSKEELYNNLRIPKFFLNLHNPIALVHTKLQSNASTGENPRLPPKQHYLATDFSTRVLSKAP
jgi:hypothetical protein